MSKCLLPLACCCALAGCQTFALSLAGAGASAALGYSLNGVTYRTFTAPYPAVKKASMAALKKMGITLESFGQFEDGEIICARAEGRTVEQTEKML